MNTINKDQPIKEKLLEILSNALTQEEELGKRIKVLEDELAVARKQHEEAQTEYSPYGQMSATSKESFRIDYYKAGERGRLKGIIEHLPSRQKKSFQGLGTKPIAEFMGRFLAEEAKQQKSAEVPKEALPIEEPILPPPPVEEVDEATLPLPETEDMPMMNLEGQVEETGIENTTAAEPMAERAVETGSGELSSELIQRLRTQLQNQRLIRSNQQGGHLVEQQRTHVQMPDNRLDETDGVAADRQSAVADQPLHAERIWSEIDLTPSLEASTWTGQASEMVPTNHTSRLIERLRATGSN